MMEGKVDYKLYLVHCWWDSLLRSFSIKKEVKDFGRDYNLYRYYFHMNPSLNYKEMCEKYIPKDSMEIDEVGRPKNRPNYFLNTVYKYETQEEQQECYEYILKCIKKFNLINNIKNE